MNAIAQYLQERTAAERRVLPWLGAAIVIAVAVTFVWLPIERARTRLTAQLPALRASIATLEREADEVKRLRAMPAIERRANEPLGAFASGGNPPAGARVSVLDARTVAVNGDDVAFGALLEWLAATQVSQGLRVDSARIEALPVPGRVRAEVRLSRT